MSTHHISRHEEFTQSILDTTADIFYQTDREGRILRITKTVTPILGYNPNALVGRKIADFFINSDSEANLIKLLKENSGLAQNFEAAIRHAEGRVVLCSINAKIRYDTKGRSTGIEGSIKEFTDRDRVEAALRESEKRFQDIAASTSDWFWELGPDLKVTYISDRFFEIADIPREEVFEKTRFELAGEKQMERDKEKWAKHLDELTNHRPFTGFQYDITGTSGKVYTIELSGVPFFDEAHNFLGYRGAGRDLTEQRKAEAALRESEKRFRDIADSASDWFWELGPDLKFTYVSDRFFEITNKPRKDVFGKSRFEVAGENQRGRDKEKWERHREDLTNHRPFTGFEYDITGTDGKVYTIELSGVPVFNEAHNFMGFRGAGKDLTRQKQAEREIKESEEKYRSFFQNSGVAIAILDQTGGFIQTNEKWSEMLGYNQQELLELKCKDVTHQDDWEDYELKFKKLFSEGGNDLRLEKRFVHKGGEICWVDLTATPIQGSERSIEAAMVVCVDITEQKKVQEALHEAKEQAENATAIKDKFVSLVAHDLRSPIAAVIGLLQMIDNSHPDRTDETPKELIGLAINRLEGSINLIKKVLDIHRLQTGKFLANKKIVKMEEVLLGVFGMRELAGKKGITLSCEIPMDLTIFADIVLLGQLFENLIQNSIKFSTQGGEIKFYMVSSKPLILAIKDTGVGIQEDILPDLFRHDIQTTTLGTNDERGTGLGLPLCYDIIQAHGGRIWVESEPGKGSTFYLEIPDQLPKVLIVDDDLVFRKIERIKLTQQGIPVLEAENGEEALRIIKDEKPTLVICDINMPVMDGLDFLEALKKNPETNHINVIMVTADTNIETRKKVFSLGAADFLTKPLEEHEFIPRVHRFLS